MTVPTVAELEAATDATAAAIADPDADLLDVYLAAEAEEAAHRQIFTGPCDRQPAPLAARLEAAEPEPEIEL
jgi:hypothetical protein